MANNKYSMGRGSKKKKKQNTGIAHALFSGSTFAGNITSGLIVSLVGLLVARLVQNASKSNDKS